MEELEYGGVPLKYFCMRFKIDYEDVLKSAKRLEETGIYLGYEYNDLIKLVMDQKTMSQYKFKGISLIDYCKKNGISYQCVMSKLKELLNDEKYKECNIDELIEMAIINKRVIYIYKGKPLSRYCQEKGISYNTIVTRIKSLMECEELKDTPLDKIIEDSVSECYFSRKTYFYKGKTLHKYCQENGIAYSTVANKINELKNSEMYKNYEISKIIKLVIEAREKKSKGR